MDYLYAPAVVNCDVGSIGLWIHWTTLYAAAYSNPTRRWPIVVSYTPSHVDFHLAVYAPAVLFVRCRIARPTHTAKRQTQSETRVESDGSNTPKNLFVAATMRPCSSLLLSAATPSSSTDDDGVNKRVTTNRRILASAPNSAEGFYAECGVVEVGVGVCVLIGAMALACFRVCQADQIIIKTGAGIKTVWSGRKTVVWPFVQQHRVVSLAPTTFSFVLTAMSKEFLQADLPIDVVTRPASPYDNPEEWKLFCQNMSGADDQEVKRVISSALEGKVRAVVAQREIVDVFNDGRAECNDILASHVSDTLRRMGVEVVSMNIRAMDDENGFFSAHRMRATEGAVLVADADVAQRRCVSVLEQEEQKRKQLSGVALTQQMTRSVKAEQEQIAVTNENAELMRVAESDAKLAVTCAEARRKSEMANVDTDAAVKEQAAVRAAQVQIKEREAEEQRLRATTLATCNVGAEAKQREALGNAYVVRIKAEGEAVAIRLVAEAERDRALLQAEGTRSKLQAEADGYLQLLKAYDENPGLAQFLKGNESGLWAEQAKQKALALQNLNPTYHVWQTNSSSGNKDPLLALAEQVMPVMHMVGHKVMPDGPAATLKAVIDALQPPPAHPPPTPRAQELIPLHIPSP